MQSCPCHGFRPAMTFHGLTPRSMHCLEGLQTKNSEGMPVSPSAMKRRPLEARRPGIAGVLELWTRKFEIKLGRLRHKPETGVGRIGEPLHPDRGCGVQVSLNKDQGSEIRFFTASDQSRGVKHTIRAFGLMVEIWGIMLKNRV